MSSKYFGLMRSRILTVSIIIDNKKSCVFTFLGRCSIVQWIKKDFKYELSHSIKNIQTLHLKT